MDEEYIQAIKAKFERQRIYDQKLVESNIRNSKEIDELVDTINDVLRKFDINESIDKSHIRFCPDYIGNITWIEDKRLSELVFDNIFAFPDRERYSHYTTFNGAKSILESGKMRLFNLLNNFDDGEFREFYEDHGIDGYREKSETLGIKTDYRSLMSEIFALCLTNESNPACWDEYANKGTGVKFVFEVTPKNNDFKKVYYSDSVRKKEIPLLKELFDTIQKKYDLPLALNYISKIGAFYINGEFRDEKEYRLIVKKGTADYDTSQVDEIPYAGDITYIEIPFQNNFADLKIVALEKGANCTKERFHELTEIVKNNYPNIEIIQ